MGVFSWNTSDTKESIPATRNLEDRPVFTVYMLAPDGRVWEEDDYEGYGVFGGKDYYELMAEINNVEPNRSNGIELEYCGDKGILRPRLVRNSKLKYEDVPDPTQCKFQGYFYYDEEEDE
jgi:hypothetical protein